MMPATDPLRAPATVFIVDDESSIRTSMTRLLRSAGLRAEAFASVDDFFKQSDVPPNSCIVADISMPGTSSLALPGALAERGLQLPIIFVTAEDNEQVRAEAKRVGAAGYFRKPIDDCALLDAIEWALRDSNPSAEKAEL